MGVLNQVLDSVMGSSGGGSPLQSVLMSIVGGGPPGGMPSMGISSGSGGLGGLVSKFEQVGLGHIIQSWIGNRPNQAVSPQQLQTVFGDNQVQTMSKQAGMEPGDLLSQLSQHLPKVVDGMTPDGRLPSEGVVSV